MNNHISTYVADVIKLAKTIVLKSEESADRVNSLIQLKYGGDAVKLDQPLTWKYYLNIAGEYHPTDTKMSIVSLDTMQEIEFNKANLVIHAATRNAYQYGSRYYFSLLSRYPQQEQLILGILYPCDIDTAIAAENGTILAYPKELVEDREITLIEDLDQWTRAYMSRWHVRAFCLTDALYPASQLAVLYLNMVPKILNLRTARCKTSEAHSFHIRQYLASHGRLDRYMDYMTLKQQLFFYRNICYIERHAGRNATFTWLIEKLLSDRQIPIADYSARHTGTFDSVYYPDYRFRKRPLNTQYNVPEKDYFNLPEILDKEAPLAPGNQLYSSLYEDKIDKLFKNSVSSVVQTKLLESTMLDYTDAVPHKLSDVLLNEWGHLSANGYYRVTAEFKDPSTGHMRTLFTDEAFVYMVYLIMKQTGVTLEKVVPYKVDHVNLFTRPTVDVLKDIVDMRYFSQYDSPEHLIPDWIVNKQPIVKEAFSKENFFNYALNVFNVGLEQWYLAARTEHKDRRAYVENMAERMYCDEVIHFPWEGTPYAQWLADHDIDDYAYSHSELTELVGNIVNSATGYSIDPKYLIKNVQKAMLDTLTQLSSYSIQIVGNINDQPITIINWPAVRIGDIETTALDEVYVPVCTEILSADGESSDTVDLELDEYAHMEVIEERSNEDDSLNLDVTITYTVEHLPDDGGDLNIAAYSITSDYAGRDEKVMQKYGIIGMEGFLALTDEQKRSIPDLYENINFI